MMKLSDKNYITEDRWRARLDRRERFHRDQIAQLST